MNNDRPLRSPSLRRVIALVALACSVAFTSPLLAVDAGRFMVVVGDVRVVDDNGRSQPAIRGSLLSSGDTVVTGENALAQLSMVDNGRISLRENTEFKLDEYNFKQEEPSAGRMFVNLLRGSFRSLTGLIGSNNRAGYRVRTPHATLGVRGTDHETTVILAPREGFDPGTFDVVFQGRTVLRSAQGQIEISPRQAGYVGAANLTPRIIPIPTFLQAAPTARAPTPPGTRSQAAAKASPPGSNKAKQLDRKKALLNPLSDSKLQSPTRTTTTTTKTLESPTLRTLDSTTLKTLEPTTTTTTTRTLDSSKLESSTTLKTLDSSTLKSLDTSTTRTLDSSTLKSLDTSTNTILKSPTTTTSPTLTSPTRTLSPTLTAPTTTISPKITAPTTTTSPTLTAPKTTISPTLTSPTR